MDNSYIEALEKQNEELQAKLEIAEKVAEEAIAYKNALYIISLNYDNDFKAHKTKNGIMTYTINIKQSNEDTSKVRFSPINRLQWAKEKIESGELTLDKKELFNSFSYDYGSILNGIK